MAADPATGQPTPYDWPLARRLYVEGLPSDDADEREDGQKWLNLRQLAEHLNYPYDTVRRHAAADRWGDQRQNYLANVERQRQAERTANLARQAVSLDQRAVRVAAVGLGLVQRALAVRLEAIVAAQGADKAATIGRQADAHELAALALAARRWLEVGNRALGRDVRELRITGPEGGAVEVDVLTAPRGDVERLERVVGILADVGALGQLAPAQANGNGHGPAGNGHDAGGDPDPGGWYDDLVALEAELAGDEGDELDPDEED